ncbi:MAG: chloride channel protein [Ignavibacteriae bacterium]|nr:chloride channel protein [Ignavibacteriota bacterium]
MENINLLNNGIPIAPSLTPTLLAENYEPRNNDNKKRLLTISYIAFLIAIIISIVAKFLVYLIDYFTNISFYGNFSFSHSSPVGNSLGIFVIFVPAIGGIIVGLMAIYGSKAIRGHGIPEAMEQILTNNSKIKPAITFLKPLSSAISIGTGGPFGAEGPIIATGGAFGSTVGQLLKISHNERKILLAAGATSGMAAIFGTPIAAIFLAIELLLFEFSPRSLVPVAIACMVGSAGHHLLFSSKPVFEMGSISSPDISTLLVCILIGLIIGLLSVFVSKTVYFIEECFEKLPIHWMWWPAIGGLFVGIIGYFAPSTLGVGYDNITSLLAGNLTIQIVFSLCILKFISWAIALGSGTSGGTLAPLLTIGGAIGTLLGMTIIHFFPSSGITIPLAALIGMAAMFAGSSRALLTSIVFALETTFQINALLPVLITCVVSYLVSLFLMEHTIMTEKIARRGVRTPNSYEPDILEKISVEQIIKKDGVVLSEENSIKEICDWLNEERNNNANYFIVTNNDGEYKGILSSNDLLKYYLNPNSKIKTLVKSNRVSIGLNQTLRFAVEVMAKSNVEILPVVSQEGKNLVGLLSYHDIINVYKDGIDKDEIKQPHISLKRNGLKILLHGQKLIELTMRKNK